MFIVGNKYRGAKGVYCGRPTALGNPYSISANMTRDQACDAYEAHFDKVKDDPIISAVLTALLQVHRVEGTVTLVCYCAPKRCHCDTIARYLNGKLECNE
jgi:hypothetical protein